MIENSPALFLQMNQSPIRAGRTRRAATAGLTSGETTRQQSHTRHTLKHLTTFHRITVGFFFQALIAINQKVI